MLPARFCASRLRWHCCHQAVVALFPSGVAPKQPFGGGSIALLRGSSVAPVRWHCPPFIFLASDTEETRTWLLAHEGASDRPCFSCLLCVTCCALCVNVVSNTEEIHTPTQAHEGASDRPCCLIREGLSIVAGLPRCVPLGWHFSHLIRRALLEDQRGPRCHEHTPDTTLTHDTHTTGDQ